MDKKKVFLLLISLVIMTSMFSNTAFAQQQGLGGIAETFYKLFGFISDLVTVEKLVDNNAIALFWAKFLIWLLLFAAIYFGAGFVFKERNNIQVVVAVVIALIGTLTIPNTVIIGIFSTYSLAASVIVWFVPIAAGLYFAHKVENRMLKGVFYFLLLIILFNIDRSLTDAKLLGLENQYFKLLIGVVFIAFFLNLFAAFGGRREHVEEAAGWLGDRARGALGWATGRRERGEEAPEEAREEEEVREEERRTERRLESIERSRERLTEIEARLAEYIAYPYPDIRARFGDIAALLNELREVQRLLEEAEEEIRGMARG